MHGEPRNCNTLPSFSRLRHNLAVPWWSGKPCIPLAAGPITAAKRSMQILKRTWGEALIANFGIGFIVFIGYLIAILPIVLGGIICASGLVPVGAALIAVGIALLLAVALISTALNSIIIGALYLYAAEGTVPQQFDDDLFRHAFARK